MKHRSVLLVLVALLGCKPPPRIVPTVPDAGTCSSGSCGAQVSVSTALAPGTALTIEECSQVCASVWCELRPISEGPGCTLTSMQEVSCAPTVYDCGYCFDGCGYGNTCGTGCCDSLCCNRAMRPECARGSACSECPPPDARCSMSNCASFKACGGALDTEPSPTVCADADGGVDPLVDLTAFCPDACNAKHAGDEVEQCPSDAGVVDAGVGSCVDTCASERTQCEAACTRASYGDCMQCAATCGVAFGQCRRACP